MKVAILHSGDPQNMKGIMNFVHEKAYRMQYCGQSDFNVDLFCVRQEYTRLFSWFILGKRYKPSHVHASSEVIDGVTYNYIWTKYGLYDCFISNKLFKHIISLRYFRKFDKELKGYDVISSHNLDCHQIALRIKTKYHIPVVCTWHGTDIHTMPFTKNGIFDITKGAIEHADINFFVSKNLLETSEKITTLGIKQVLYTGPSSIFYRYTDKDRKECRKKLDVTADYIIGFVGNLFDIKNVMIIPDVLSSLTKKIPSDKKLSLVIVGDGPLRKNLEESLERGDVCFSFLGNMLPANIPDVMNGLDILLLPSKNEGLPLVTLEALKCGTNVVGSNVGGIPEAIGNHNSFVLDDTFVDKISSRMAEILINSEVPEPIDNKFSWDAAINNEIQSYYHLIRLRH